MKESGEMYLETILVLSLEKEYVRAIDVSEEMGFSKASVSRALSKLKNDKYISIDSAGHISLSKSGLEIAKKIYERHETLTEFFTTLGVSPEVAAEDACRIEHVISDESFRAIKNKMK